MNDDITNELDSLMANWSRRLVGKIGNAYAVAVATRRSEGLVGQWMRGESRPAMQDVFIMSLMARDFGFFPAVEKLGKSHIGEAVPPSETEALQLDVFIANSALNGAFRGYDALQMAEAIRKAKDGLAAKGVSE